ncbi:MAG: hypothetical protein KDA42_11480 [Planctomycetales bacterium]|nr:hypothetical protein [Planctomycetales bacterium]
MLLIISDLHLTDGTSGSTISSGAFNLLSERIEDLAQRAGNRADGRYRPIDRIDLVLLGDVLDVIRSSRWLEGDVRPWDDPQSPAMIDTVRRITDAIIERNALAMSTFRELASSGGVKVCPASNLARPMMGAEPIPVPVRIHYLVGNHDWFFHLPGEPYDAIRRRVVEAMGLANPATQPFPHDPHESDELMAAQRRHKLFARHGDIYDPFNFEQDRDMSSLGDAIVIELLNRFSAQVESELGDDLPMQTLLGLREIDNIRPLVLIPVWIDGLLERTCGFPALRRKVKLVWDALADRFLDLNFVRQRDTWNPADLVDGLQQALHFSKGLSLDTASAMAQWLLKIRGASTDSYYVHALTEQDFRNRRAKHIVYGHTHHAETVPLDASYADGHVLNQVYFNSGTWRRVYRQTQFAPKEHEFIPADTMTYLAFFQGDERKGRPYEMWNASLAVRTPEIVSYRVDQGVDHHAAGQPVSPPKLQPGTPHFATADTLRPIVPTRRV